MVQAKMRVVRSRNNTSYLVTGPFDLATSSNRNPLIIGFPLSSLRLPTAAATNLNFAAVGKGSKND